MPNTQPTDKGSMKPTIKEYLPVLLAVIQVTLMLPVISVVVKLVAGV